MRVVNAPFRASQKIVECAVFVLQCAVKYVVNVQSQKRSQYGTKERHG